MLGIDTAQVQDLIFGHVKLHEVHTALTLRPVKVLLDGIPSFQHIDSATQLGVSKLANGCTQSDCPSH